MTNADGYEIYVAPCGSKFTSAPTKTITTGSTKAWNLTKLNGKKLNLTKNYKVKIYAYRNVDGTKTRIADGYMLHIAGPKSAAYTNAKQVSAKKSSYSVKAGKTLQLVFSVNRENSRKSNLPKSHVALLRYWSTDKSIATVSSNGKVKGVKKGTCYVYAIAANGAKKKVKITVK